jgi:hypothetical protein
VLIHADTFSRYGGDISLLLNGLYAQAGGYLVPDPDGVSSGLVYQAGTDSSGGSIRFVLPALDNVSGVAFRQWIDVLPGSLDNSPIVRWHNDAGDVVWHTRLTTSGRLQLLASDNTVIGTSALPIVTANGWWHVEMKMVFGTAGTCSFECRVEGITVMHLTGQTFGSAPYSVSIGHTVNGSTGFIHAYFKDYVIWDSTGTYNNDFLGSVLVYDLVPTGDVTLGGWTSTDANGWSVLDNNPPDNAHYLDAAYPPPAACEFSFSDLPANITSVKGLITRVRAAKVDGGDGNLQVSAKHGSSAQTGANRPITVAQTYYQDVFEVDPSTSAPWVPLGVAAMTAKLDRTV